MIVMSYRPMVDANHSADAEEFAAVLYEEQAARRDYSEAFERNPYACAVWSLSAYLDAAQAAAYSVARGERS
ncbi:hypothetical protein ACWD2L_05945 [Streptomyces sp. NPDC002754]